MDATHLAVVLVIAAAVGVAVFCNFIPFMFAVARRHRASPMIFFVCLFFGWTFFGWFIALAWSFDGNTD